MPESFLPQDLCTSCFSSRVISALPLKSLATGNVSTAEELPSEVENCDSVGLTWISFPLDSYPVEGWNSLTPSCYKVRTEAQRLNKT